MLDFKHFRCRRIRSLFWDYASDRLPESLLEQVEHHLTGCAGCRQEMDGLRKAQALLFAARSETPPPSQTNWQQLRAQIEAEESRPVALSGGSALVSAGRWDDERRARRRLPRAASWMPNLAMASTVACLMLTAALSYRLFAVLPLTTRHRSGELKPLKSVPSVNKNNSSIQERGQSVQVPNESLSETPASQIVYAAVPAVTSPSLPRLHRTPRSKSGDEPLRQRVPDTELVSYHTPPNTETNYRPEPKQQPKKELPKNSGKKKDNGFRPYHGPQEKLPESDPSTPRYPLDRIVPVGNAAQGALAMESVRPSPPDEERAY